MITLLERALELKVRHVRTPEGVRKYNLPIGSPIVARAKKLKVKKVSNKPIDKGSVQEIGESGLDQYRDKVGVYWRMPNFQEMSRGIEEVGHHKDGRKFYIQKDRISKSWYVTIRDKNDVTIGKLEHLRGAKTAHNAVVRMLKDEEARKPRRVKRDYVNAFDYDEGVYGWDWDWGDEEDESTRSLIDIAGDDTWDQLTRLKARSRLADIESNRLGISVLNSADGRHRIDVASHEIVNRVHNMYEQMFPGFTKLQPVYRMAPEYNGTPGWAAFNETKYDYNGPGPDGTQRKHAYTGIGLNPKHWGTGFDEYRLGEGGRYSSAVSGSGHYSVDIKQVSEDHNLELWQATQMHMLHHETGHSFARVILESLATYDIAEKGRNEVHDLLLEYGLIEAEVEEGWRTSLAIDSVLKKQEITEHVSKYAATSLHELMAESWAAYITSDRPTEFQVAMGQIMEYYMQLAMEVFNDRS